MPARVNRSDQLGGDWPAARPGDATPITPGGARGGRAEAGAGSTGPGARAQRPWVMRSITSGVFKMIIISVLKYVFSSSRDAV